MNKRAEMASTVDMFSFLFLLVIILMGIFAGIFLFFGKGIDFREVNADVLSHKIKSCISEKEGWEEDFYGVCGLRRESFDGDLIFKVCEGNCGSDNSVQGVVSSGGDFVLCRLKSAVKNENFIYCISERIEIDGKEYEVLTGSKGKLERRVI